ESGSWEIYVRAFPSAGEPVQVSRDGGRVPRWSATGHELFYGTDDQRLMVASYAIRGGTFVPGPPRQWTHIRLADTGVSPTSDRAGAGGISGPLLPPAGTPAPEPANQATMFLLSADELRRRAP